MTSSSLNIPSRGPFKNIGKLKRLWLKISMLSITMTVLLPVNSWALDVSLDDALATPVFDSSCHNYCIVGACFWLQCNLFGCSIETSARIRHYNPDLLVSVYPQVGRNPFESAQDLMGDAELSVAKHWVKSFHRSPVGGGPRVEGGHSGVDQSLIFKEATAVGHPLAAIGPLLGQVGWFCPSGARPLYPYFSSAADAPAWRFGLPDSLNIKNLLPGRRVIGEGLWQQWGSLWPRTGFLLQKDDAKAAAVIAQRVGNIVTQTRQAHVYLPLRKSRFNKSWSPSELKENRPSTGLWQMLAPVRDEQCYAFGENDVLGSPWSQGRQSPTGDYVFNLWRPYTCCQARGAYLSKVDIPEICL